jgi:pimeloyl-ACP methyl ester carboxylesterase
VLLHGFSDSADTWREVLAHLRVARRAAVALDLPGFATADPLERSRGVLDQLGEFAAAAAEQFAADGAVLAGNSLGGTASLIAAAGGAPLSGVVAIAPAGFDMAGWIYRLRNFTLLQLLLRVPPVVPGPLLREVVGRSYRQFAICEQRAVPAAVVHRFASHHRDRATVLSYLQIAERLLPELLRPLPIDGIAVPVTVIWGRQDRMLPVRNAKLLSAQLPAARIEILDPCGHCPQVERPAKTAELLLSAV